MRGSVLFKHENWIVVGIIPNLPKEPNSLEHFIRPLVDELQLLWKGVKVRTADHPSGLYIRGALINLSCDVPAGCKLIGFLGNFIDYQKYIAVNCKVHIIVPLE